MDGSVKSSVDETILMGCQLSVDGFLGSSGSFVEKVMRGLKKDKTPIIKGYQLFHNYIREHEGLDGKTPAEACGITVQGNNKWLTLIQNASQSKS